jgi:hypothetical protein
MEFSSIEDTEARKKIAELEHQIASNAARVTALETECSALKTELSALKTQQTPAPAPAPEGPIGPSLDSLILREFPMSILSEFQAKRFVLLWRGTRDGFAASTFHKRCDGHSNSLTVIQDINGYVFGGFTPLSWSSSGGYYSDSSVRSFSFTLSNPAGSAAMKFSLAQSQNAIWCHGGYGPIFGNGSDICVVNQSDANLNSRTSLGTGYTNHTGRASNQVFTGAHNFRAKEIEVFEIVG